MALCVAMAALAPHGRAATLPSTDSLPCSRFEWSATATSPRAAILVPIRLNGRVFRYQLDTGADEVVLYGTKSYPGWTKQGVAMRIPRVQFAGMSLPAMLGYRMPGMSDDGVQGTVGLDLLVGRVLLLDFPKQRVCMMNRADVPVALMDAADWTPAQIRDGKLFLSAELDGKPLTSLMYDTGTSPDDLLVDLGEWKAMTGNDENSAGVTHETALSWGQSREFLGAPATGTLKLGKRSYPTPRVRTTPSRPNAFRDEYFGAQGALGNALFFDSIVILDLGSHPEFGVIGPPQR